MMVYTEARSATATPVMTPGEPRLAPQTNMITPPSRRRREQAGRCRGGGAPGGEFAAAGYAEAADRDGRCV